MTRIMNLWRRQNGRYYVWIGRDHKHPRGRLVSLRTTDPGEARQLYLSWRKKWHEDRLVELDRGVRIALVDYAELYVTHPERVNLSPDTLRMDRLALRSLGDVISHRRAVRAVNATDLTRYLATCQARGLSPHTIRTYLRHLRAALNFAGVLGYRDRLPRIPKVRAPKTLPKTIPSEDLDAILSYAMSNDYQTWRYIQFSLWTGCRLQEAVGLKWPDITFCNQPTTQIHGRARIFGKGKKERSVPLLAPAVEAFGPQKDLGPVFKPMHPDTLSHYFADIVVACGLTGPTFHGLRHTAATRMVTAGIKIEVIQKILGHADIRTTQIYAQIYDQVVDDEMSKLM